MATKIPSPRYSDEYELSQGSSHSSDFSSNYEYDREQNAHLLSGYRIAKTRHSNLFGRLVSRFLRRWYHARPARTKRLSRTFCCSRQSLTQKFVLASYSFFAFLLLVTVAGFTVFPSYTRLPPHYEQLKDRVTHSTTAGAGNVRQEKIFIAASLFDPEGHLVGGQWAENVLNLIHLLGPQNTFLSIYENDSGPQAAEALSELQRRTPCNHSLIFEDHLGFDGLPQVTTPEGAKRVKRIAYLSAVRNKALEPLEESSIKFDRILYLNDVFFDPVDALQLLFSTNVDDYGHADYRAACAVDFINPFKFYDTFATRDLGGWGMGIPFFPWFAAGGDSRSLQDVLEGTDAVRVRSCWGGMVAFDARLFQSQDNDESILVTAAGTSPSNITGPYRFRAEPDLYWDASECCLIQADVQSPDSDHPGIYMNPFVRVAYDPTTLSWLWFTRRFERLYTPIHYMLDILVGFPRFNPRRSERAWQQVEEIAWVRDDSAVGGGSFEHLTRYASHTGFCGRRKLPVMKEHLVSGEKNYEFIPIPAGAT